MEKKKIEKEKGQKEKGKTDILVSITKVTEIFHCFTIVLPSCFAKRRFFLLSQKEKREIKRLERIWRENAKTQISEKWIKNMTFSKIKIIGTSSTSFFPYQIFFFFYSRYENLLS